MLTISNQGTRQRCRFEPADLKTAERLCRQILRIDPSQADAWHLLGIVTHSQGRNREAVDAIRRAMAIAGDESDIIDRPSRRRLDRAIETYRHSFQQDPASADVYYNLGCEQLDAGECGDAVSSFEHALEIRPDWTEARRGLGEACYLAEDYLRSIENLEPIAAAAPDRSEINRMLAECFLKTANAPRAIERLQAALQFEPRDADLHYKLGRAHLSQRQAGRAERCFQTALQLDPDHVAAWHDRGAALLNLGNTAEAKRHFAETLARNAQHVDALCNLGLIYLLSNELETAGDYCRRAIAVDPRHAVTRNILGNVLRAQGQLAEAISEFQSALQLSAAFTEAHNNLALAYQTQGRIEDAVTHYRRAVKVRTDCAATHSNLLLSLHYLPDNDPQTHFQEHLNWAAAHGQCRRIEQHNNTRDPARRLRIGYVSPDFRVHPVGTFIEPILRNHDTANFEITCYSNATAPDDVTARIEASADRWRVTNWLNDDDLAATILTDGIDILVDLAGHTAGNRLSVMARKPAPVQMTYLGYGGTTGLEAVDYRLTDAVADPDGEPVCHTEQLVRLERGLLCFEPPATAPPVAPSPHLRNGFVTFGSFNNPAKINSATVELWSRILSVVPSARLLLKYPTFKDAGTAEHCRQLFAGFGIDLRRIEFRGGKLPFDEHLSAYGEIDVMLDPIPYTGSTTTCESLWMGVPVLTLRGRTFVGRISASILTQLNMPELIAETAEEYVARAARLAEEADKLSDIRTAIHEEVRNSPLCDAVGYTRELEAVYRRAWRQWCREESSSLPQ